MKRALLALVVIAAVAAAAVAVYRSRRPLPPPAPSQAELDALVAKRTALKEKLLDLTVRKDDQGIGRAPQGSIMLGLPTSFTRAVIEQVVTGLFRETTLTLKNLKVHKAGDVKAKMVFSKRKVGEYVLDVDIHEVSGLLKPGKPTLTFGRDQVGVRLPVALAEGEGRGTLRIQWDSKGLAANAVCGDKDITTAVTGTVVPADYVVEGQFGITAMGDTIVLRPDFGELKVKVTVAATEKTWAAVDQVIEAQGSACRTALKKIDLKAILAKIIGKGFNVRIPAKIFKPIRLPAGVQSSLELQGVKLALQVKPTGMTVTRDRIWYGADIRTGADAAPPGPAAPGNKPEAAPAPSKPPA